MSSLSIERLAKQGAFAGAPVEKEITWTSGGSENTATVFVRKLSYASAVSDITSKDAIAGRIASSIVDETGKPVFTVADVTGEADPERGPLNHGLTIALLQVIGEVNGLGKQETSRKKRKSGTSLSFAGSAEEPSKRPNEDSVTQNSVSGHNTDQSADVSIGG